MKEGTITVKTSGHMAFVDVTKQINQLISQSGHTAGICYLYNPHTTSAVTINEGADPDVQEDILNALKKMVPNLHYKHMEGNSPAHVMTTLVGASEMIFFENGSLKLGTWQRIFFCEFDGPRTRKLHWRLLAA